MSARKRPPRADLEKAIRDAGGNLSKTAAALGCTRTTLYCWIYQYGLDRLAGIETREVLQARARSVAPLAPSKAPEPTLGLTAVTTKLPSDLWKWAKIVAVERDTTAAAIVVEALELLRAVVDGKVAEAGS